MSIPRIAPYAMPRIDLSARVNWQIDPSRAVLLIHDMQDYFVDFFDAQAEPLPTLVQHIAQLRAACDTAGVPVVYTAQPAEQSPAQRGLLQDWWGPGITARPALAPVLHAIAPRPGDTVLTKWRYSAFQRSDLRERMQTQGRDQLIVCGVYAHIGCLLTAAEAFMNDIQPFFVGDAVADFSAQEHAMALSYVAQRCGVVRPTAQLIAALQASPPATTGLPTSLHALRAEVAALLEWPASELHDSPLHENDNLLDCGLDSIRLMSLTERWRAAGLSRRFVDWAETPTLSAWWAHIARHLATGQPIEEPALAG